MSGRQPTDHGTGAADAGTRPVSESAPSAPLGGAARRSPVPPRRPERPAPLPHAPPYRGCDPGDPRPGPEAAAAGRRPDPEPPAPPVRPRSATGPEHAGPARAAARARPVPDDGTAHHAAAPRPPGPYHDRLVEEWLRAVCGIGSAASRTELRRLLDDLAERLTAQLVTASFRPDAGDAAGRALVAAGLTAPEALSGTIAVLGRWLLPAAAGSGDAPTWAGRGGEARPVARDEAESRLGRLQGALAAGYVTALHERTLSGQEAVRRSMLAARVEASRALQTSEARFRGVFDAAAIGIAVASLDGRLLEVNDSLAGMLGYSADLLRAGALPRFAHADDADAVREALRGLIDGSGKYRADKRFRHSDGQLVWTHLTMSLVRDPHGAPQHAIVLMVDVTDRHRLHARLAHQATHDPLTGLPNRALFHERLDDVFRRPAEGARFGVCYLDLDGFKEVNDTAGHGVGDELLTRVARRLHDALSGPGRLVARLGGDEFVVLMEHSAGPDDAVWVARAALDAARCAFGKAGQEVRITASAGVVERPVRGGDPADAMRAADTTLYWAKAAGKDRYAVFDAQRDARQTARYRLGAQLPRGLERGEFFVLYQPIVRLPDRRPTAAEALVRWRHPEHGVLAPGAFIHLAEENGLIGDLGRYVLRESCRQAEQWWRRDPAGAPAVSVNLSARQCADESLVEQVSGVLRETGLPANRLQLELTESAVMHGGRPLAALWELSAMGVRVALDDFGTGYSNLSYLRTLPVSGLKIDRSFIQRMRDGRAGAGGAVDERIVAALTQLARAVDLTVTVEGVETERQATRLARLGCDLGQGLLFGGPGPAGPTGPLDAREVPDALHVGEQAEPPPG